MELQTISHVSKNLCVENNRRKMQANRLLYEFGLFEKLKEYGTPHIIGSYKMDLMAWNDLDLDICIESMSIEKIYELTSFIISRFKPCWYEAKQEVGSEGKNVWFHGFETLIPGELWNVDIWFFDSETINKAEKYSDSIINQVKNNEKMKKSIIQIKQCLIEKGLYNHEKFISIDVYKAVIDMGIQNVEEFLQRYQK